MLFSGRSKSIGAFVGREEKLTRCYRSFSLLSWSLRVYKGSNVENWGEMGTKWFTLLSAVHLGKALRL